MLMYGRSQLPLATGRFMPLWLAGRRRETAPTHSIFRSPELPKA
ncbi:MAG: hypothetical protein ACK41Q_09215 [Candidatus Brocadia sp.]